MKDRATARHDLHLHTTLSDGRYTPEDMLSRCGAAGLDVVALTDHDLAGPIAAGVHEVGGRAVQVLVGAELSGVHEGREYHLLVYFSGEPPASFRAFCRSRCQERAERYEAGREAIGVAAVPPADAQAREGHRALTRHHLARSLVEGGHARGVSDAFARWMSGERRVVPTVRLPFVEAIEVARSAGGVTSWAHPPMPALRRYLPVFVAAGLQGVEIQRPGLPRRYHREAVRLARAHGVFATGGSDWHGWTDPPLGLFSVPGRSLSAFYEALAAAA